MRNVPKNPLGVSLRVEIEYYHRSYDWTSSYFDIGIIKTENVTFNEFIRPICLPRWVKADVDTHKGKATQLLGK